jgi:uncharacterized repeat protein (TIGR03803 family)
MSSVRASDIERVLYSFPPDGSTGANPNSGVVAWQGDLYGTTYFGGQSRAGVLFRLHHGRERVLHSFGGHGDFGGPYGRLVIDEAGTIYGATGGSVYKLTAAGVYTTLHAFTGGSDGAGLIHGLSADAAGNLYGTTEQGGATNCDNGCGIVFKITPDGQETVFHSFGGTGDGWNPKARVTLDAAGNVYGTTYQGGTYNRGTIFKLTPAGQLTLLYSFPGDGHPYTGVALDPAGNVYGTSSDLGSIWKLTPDNVFTTLSYIDGVLNTNDPIIDAVGNLYGVTSDVGGEVYRVAPDGTTTTLYQFTGGDDGSLPIGSLYMDPKGNLYGTTYYEGGGSGCVFKVLNDVN